MQRVGGGDVLQPEVHRPSELRLEIAIMLFGATAFVVDWIEGLPRFWRLGEGPFVVFFGAIILWLVRRVESRGP